MFSITNIHIQKPGIFQAYAGSKGPDQPENIQWTVWSKYYLHVVRFFKQCKIDQSADATLYQPVNVDMHVETEALLFEYENKISNGTDQIRKYWCIRIIERKKK